MKKRKVTKKKIGKIFQNLNFMFIFKAYFKKMFSNKTKTCENFQKNKQIKI